MKNIFKEIKTRYYEFLDYRDESQECFINKKGEIVAIVTMCSLLSYLFYSVFYKKSHDVYATNEDFLRLYDVKKNEMPNNVKYCSDESTLGYWLKKKI